MGDLVQVREGEGGGFLERSDEIGRGGFGAVFRGRQLALPELGREVLKRVAEQLNDVGRVEVEPSMEGRTMTMVLGPRKS